MGLFIEQHSRARLEFQVPVLHIAAKNSVSAIFRDALSLYRNRTRDSRNRPKSVMVEPAPGHGAFILADTARVRTAVEGDRPP